MAPKAETNYDAEANAKREIPNDQVMEDAGKVHLGKLILLPMLDPSTSTRSFPLAVENLSHLSFRFCRSLAGLGKGSGCGL